MEGSLDCAQVIKWVEPSGSFSLRLLKVMASVGKAKSSGPILPKGPVTISP